MERVGQILRDSEDVNFVLQSTDEENSRKRRVCLELIVTRPSNIISIVDSIGASYYQLKFH